MFFLSMHNMPQYPKCPGKPSRLGTLSSNGNQEKREKGWLADTFGKKRAEGAAKQAQRVWSGSGAGTNTH